MNVAVMLNRAMELFTQYPYVAAGLALVLLLFLYKQPKSFFKLVLLLLVILGFLYAVNLFMGATTSGSRSTRQGLEKSQQLE